MVGVSTKGDRALGLLRYVIERLAADGRYRRRRAEREQDLFLGGAERDLLERAIGQHVAALERLAEAAAGQERQREQHGKGAYGTGVPNRPSAAPHPQTHLAPSRRVPYPETQNWQSAAPKRLSRFRLSL